QYRLEESRRPGEYFPVSEDETGTFIMNSKDLCLARQVPELMRFGVDSFKIEGRMKSAFYVATVTGIYRRIVDAAAADPDFVVPPDWVAELTKVSHRHYTTAFYGGIAGPDAENFGTGSYTRNYDFAGVVLDYDAASGMATVEQRGKINEGDAIEIIQPGTGDSPLFSAQQAKGLTDAAGVPIASTPHAKMRYRLKLDQPVAPMSILRRKSAEREEALCF
ncbi:U32 family peptidase C-terminal domain-containing protein, partial [Pseudoramibacter alactolyticus]